VPIARQVRVPILAHAVQLTIVISEETARFVILRSPRRRIPALYSFF
jgi:hypothetical protein